MVEKILYGISYSISSLPTVNYSCYYIHKRTYSPRLHIILSTVFHMSKSHLIRAEKYCKFHSPLPFPPLLFPSLSITYTALIKHIIRTNTMIIFRPSNPI